MDYYFRQILLPPFVAFVAPARGQTSKLRRRRGLGQANLSAFVLLHR
jgi:hypothetical protein